MSFKRVGIIGAGTMGSGIATSLAQQGVEVRLVDTTTESVERGLSAAKKFYARAVEKGKMSEEAANQAGELLLGSTNMAHMADCDLIIEAIFEEFDVKAKLFDSLNEIAAPDAVIATNTSALRVSDLAEKVSNPARFLGLHYFNPAAINPIVEVVRGEKNRSGHF